MSSSLRVAVLAAAVAGAAPVGASVIWEGQTSRGSANFEGVELQPGRFGVVSDPRGQMGNVFYCETYDGAAGYETGKQRCEVKGTKLTDGSIWRMSENNEYYVGWRSMWDPMPTENGAWIAFMQLKGTGTCHLQPSGGAGCAAVIRTVGDGRLVAHLTCDGNYVIWSTTYPARGSWNSFVWRWRLGRSLSSGWVELWYNGVKQTFNGPRGNGTQRQPAALWECEAQRLKFGVYRSGALNGNGTARAHLWRPRVGTTYADVAPEGGGTAPTPTPTPTPTPGGSPTATPTPCTSCGFSGYYRIMARHSGKAVTVQSASTANSANVFQWTYGGTATNDEWQVLSIGSGYYRVINRNSGKDLTVASASTADGANIFQYTYGGTSTNDEWAIVDVGSGYFRITNRNSGKSAEVASGGTADGANVDQRTYGGQTYQQFQLVSVP